MAAAAIAAVVGWSSRIRPASRPPSPKEPVRAAQWGPYSTAGAATATSLAIENTALKQRVRQLTDQNRSIEPKLQAARSNNRFLDKRLADLEAALVEAQLPPGPVPDQRPSRIG